VAIAIVASRWRQIKSYVGEGVILYRTSGGFMRRTIAVASAVIVGFFLFLLQAQAQFTIHAASDQPVAGWTRMQYNNQTVWVSPTASLTSADILRAQPSKTSDGATAVGVVFNDAGAKKMTDLSHTQLNKLIAMILDGKVIFAPKVRAEVGTQALITGKGPSGLPSDVAQRIVESVNKK
jgi:preprotein translocase subunit SecD